MRLAEAGLGGMDLDRSKFNGIVPAIAAQGILRRSMPVARSNARVRFGTIQTGEQRMATARGRAAMAMGMWLLASAFATVAAGSPPADDAGARAVAAVDPFIGTGGEGHTFPGAVVPFGMVQLSPDTQIKPRKDAYGWAAGYRHDDHTIVGFSHTHFSGTGHSDLGDVLVMPIAGDVRLERGDVDKPGSGYTSRFRHDDERAEPGYYAVTLDDYGVRAELTADRARRRASLHLPARQAGACAGRPAHAACTTTRARCRGRACACTPDGTVTGFRETRGWAPGRQLYFAMRFSRPLNGHAFHDTEQDIPYKGFPPPGENDAVAARADRRPATGRRVRLRRCLARTAAGQGVDLAGQRGQRHRQPRCRSAGLGFRRRARRCEGAMGEGAGRDRHRRAGTDAQEFLHRALPRLHGAEPVHGQRRPLSRARQRRAPGQGLHELLDVLAVGYLSRAASAADPGAAGTAHQRHRQFAARLAPRKPLRHPAGVGVPRPGDVVHDRLPRRAGDRRRLHEGHPRLRHRRRARRDGRERELRPLRRHRRSTWNSATCRSTRKARPRRRRSNTRSTTGPSRAWPAAMGRKDIAAHVRASAPATGSTPSTRRPASCARASATAASASPSIPDASGYGTDYTEGNAWQYSWYVPQDVAGLAKAHGGDGQAARAASTRCSTPRSIRRPSRTWKTSPA